ncbi:hypothetical protein PspLS_08431 [Pyricularia sp. CBS 133598]|nr:hypothetical protein PspLS_08431 [Pyricularia sp. CBS 133598]
MAEYSNDDAIATFFTQTTASREECDSRALTLAGGPAVVPMAVQGVCSYTVYAGPDLGSVVQFRLKSLELPVKTAILARQVYGNLAPEVSMHGQLGPDVDDGDGGREPLLVYVMDRVKGISHLDFILANGHPENRPETFAWRKTLMVDVVHFFAAAWKSPQVVDPAWRASAESEYRSELQLLLGALPARFQDAVQTTIEALPAIMSLPVVLLHKDFGTSNIMVSETDCHLVGVVDWAEAEPVISGTNLHELFLLWGRVMMKTGVHLFDHGAELRDVFWKGLSAEASGLSDGDISAIKSARVLGLLRSMGFASRLKNMPKPVPISDDDYDCYNIMYLDGLLVNKETKFE